MPPPATVPRLVAEHLGRFAPFDGMAPDDLLWLADRASVVYFARGDVLLAPGHGTDLPLYILKSGRVQGARPATDGRSGEVWLELHEGESFPIGALLAKRGVASVFRATEDTFCYRLAAADFHALLRRSPPYHAFCTQRLANLFQASQSQVVAGYTQASAAAQPLDAKLGDVVRRAPVTCSPATPLRAALATMQSEGVGSIVAVEAGAPAGILTLHDVLDRVVLAGADLAAPVISVMSTALETLPPSAPALDAALVMARRGIRHVLLVESGQLAGVVSEKDLFGLQRLGLRQIGAAIRAAESVDALKRCAADIHALAHSLLAQGVAAESLTDLISALNDTLTRRVVELARAADAAADQLNWCWLAFGSEGRAEQTLSTDQDNGLVFDDAHDAEAARAVLLPFAKRVNDALAECGFPLCSGGVMASNPRWCLSLSEWRAQYDRWIAHGAPQDLLHATIFFDFRALSGRTGYADALHEHLAAIAPGNTRFQHQLAALALTNRPPLGLVRDFVTRDDHTLDLKLNGTAPFVDAARVVALAVGSSATGTLARLKDAAVKLGWPESDVAAWREAFLFLQLLRLRRHHAQAEAGEALSNRVDPDQLNDLDRRILKEVFRQARKLQSRLAVRYQL